MINDELLWEQFAVSGSVEAYLAYKQTKDGQPCRERTKESKNTHHEHI